MPFLLPVQENHVGLHSTVSRLGHWAVPHTVGGLNPFREMDGISAGPHHEALLIIATTDVFKIQCGVVCVVAVFRGYFVLGRAIAEKRSGDQAMDGAFSREPITGKGGVESPVLHLDGLKNFAGVGVANQSLVGNLIPVVSRDVAPLFGHTALLLGGATKRYTPWTQCRYHRSE